MRDDREVLLWLVAVFAVVWLAASVGVGGGAGRASGPAVPDDDLAQAVARTWLGERLGGRH